MLLNLRHPPDFRFASLSIMNHGIVHPLRLHLSTIVIPIGEILGWKEGRGGSGTGLPIFITPRLPAAFARRSTYWGRSFFGMDNIVPGIRKVTVSKNIPRAPFGYLPDYGRQIFVNHQALYLLRMH